MAKANGEEKKRENRFHSREMNERWKKGGKDKK